MQRAVELRHIQLGRARRLRGHPAVEQDALLHRGQRIDRLGAGQAVAAVASVAAGAEQPLQLLRAVAGEAFDRLLAVQGGAVAPVEMQPPAAHHGIELQRMRAAVARADVLAGRLRSGRKARIREERGVDLAEVVEQELGRGALTP